MKISNISELFNALDIDESILKNNLSQFLKTISPEHEKILLMSLTLKDQDNIECQFINTMTPLFYGLVGCLLYRQYIEHCADNNISEEDALKNIVALKNSLNISMIDQL